MQKSQIVRSGLICLSLLIGLIGFAFSQDRERDIRPIERPPREEGRLPPVERERDNPQATQRLPEMQEKMLRLRVLNEAAAKLEQAGLKEQAEPLRRAAMELQTEMARSLREHHPPASHHIEQMERMKHQIERLEAEVSELRQMVRRLSSRSEQPEPPSYPDPRPHHPRKEVDPQFEEPKSPITEPESVPYREEQPLFKNLNGDSSNSANHSALFE